jgi:hypothetical protein
MRNMKRLFFVVLMMTCSVSWAGWEYTGTSSDDAITYYHDKSTIRRNGVIVKIWEMKEYSTAQTNSESNRYQSDKILWAFNCREETKTITSIVEYAGSMGTGSVVSSITAEESWLKWSPIVPGSVAEVTWKIACSKK